jgi:hypothetical protein
VGAVPRLLMFAEFADQATPPEGDPPSLTVHGESTGIRALDGDGPNRAEFDTKVTMTGETAFDEEGTMTFDGGGDSISFTTLGEGYLGPSPAEGMLQGSVIWRVDDGTGRFAGATGLITSNFVMDAESGGVAEKQVISLFLP